MRIYSSQKIRCAHCNVLLAYREDFRDGDFLEHPASGTLNREVNRTFALNRDVTTDKLTDWVDRLHANPTPAEIVIGTPSAAFPERAP